MKRTDLLKQLRKEAKAQGLAYWEEEGAKHTHVHFGDDKKTTVPRHNEINEHTAKGILKYMRGE
ncbi:hypothetical protein A5742_30085 [Mycolicibacterium fortuitum]|uniref:Type II toxin-antitoxin system HicA family toxin n=1 Tax=Mycolicibacterium fortuitum TaxID=1766 RepID=A0ABD6QKC5_MYCFO|nr:hypothetical protein [Mycolicibacterium fortuitum]OMC43097.1 hypothetical protein A5742_30085 [Mycolicibacterium fortuitum]